MDTHPEAPGWDRPLNLTGTRTIETPRLTLRRFVPEDAEDMYANWASDPEVRRFLTGPTHESVENSRRVIARWLPLYEGGAYFNWAIEDKETGGVIGAISVSGLNEDTRAADVGYCLGRAFWNRGIMTEALRAVMDYLFHEVGVNRVEARHDARNPASGRVMEKAGMRLEGVSRQSGKNNSGVCDEVLRAALRSDFAPEAKQS